MIAQGQQRRGIGRRAMQQVLAHEHETPAADVCAGVCRDGREALARRPERAGAPATGAAIVELHAAVEPQLLLPLSYRAAVR
jgi:hypothetical protein